MRTICWTFAASLFLVACTSAEPPTAQCIVTALSVLGEEGIYPDSTIKITQLECERIASSLARFRCTAGVYGFMRDHPLESLATFVPDAASQHKEAAKFSMQAGVVAKQCGF